MRLKWMEPALDDLESIRSYIERDKPRAARAMARRIVKSVENIPSNPCMGRAGRVHGTREWVMPGTSYIVAYKVRDETVEVLRILHGAMNWPNSF